MRQTKYNLFLYIDVFCFTLIKVIIIFPSFVSIAGSHLSCSFVYSYNLFLIRQHGVASPLLVLSWIVALAIVVVVVALVSGCGGGGFINTLSKVSCDSEAKLLLFFLVVIYVGGFHCYVTLCHQLIVAAYIINISLKHTT